MHYTIVDALVSMVYRQLDKKCLNKRCVDDKHFQLLMTIKIPKTKRDDHRSDLKFQTEK